MRGRTALPMHLRVDVGAVRVGVVHGDAESLAGWAFSQEAFATAEGARAVERTFDEAGVDIFASSHTCLPVLQGFARDRVVVNNGAAGMPNFAGTRHGLLTRISARPYAGSARAYGTRVAGVEVDAIRIDYDADRWLARFAASWPQGSPAHASYHRRMLEGPRHGLASAAPA